MRVGEFAAAAGLTVRQVRYWNERGLLQVERTASGYRDYSSADIARAHRIDDMLSAGLSVKQVAQLSSCLDFQRGVCRQERETLARKASDIERKIACMAHTRDLINEVLASAPVIGKVGEEEGE
jgi:DNA-binding transcriptional MerR regulator